MLRDALFLGWHDLRTMLRQKETLLWTFLMPPIFFYFIGTVTGGFAGGGGGDGADPILVERAGEAGFLADELGLRLEEGGYALVEPPAQGAEATRPDRVLSVPAGFTAGVLAGDPQQVVFRSESEGLSAQFDQFRVGRAVYTVLADVVAASLNAEAELPTAEEVRAIRAMPRALELDVKRAGRERRIPSGFEQAVPGTMVMFAMIILLTSGATTLVVERREGLLRRLASAPMRRGSVVLGKWGGKLALGVVQMAFALALGTFAFGVDWGPNFAALCLVLLAYAALLSSLSLLLGNWAKTEGQAVGLGVLSANVLGALGGCWWPIEVTGPSMQKLALFLPTGWTMDAIHRLVSFGAPASEVWVHVLGMAAGALVLGHVCARTLRFQ